MTNNYQPNCSQAASGPLQLRNTLKTPSPYMKKPAINCVCCCLGLCTLRTKKEATKGSWVATKGSWAQHPPTHTAAGCRSSCAVRVSDLTDSSLHTPPLPDDCMGVDAVAIAVTVAVGTQTDPTVDCIHPSSRNHSDSTQQRHHSSTTTSPLSPNNTPPHNNKNGVAGAASTWPPGVGCCCCCCTKSAPAHYSQSSRGTATQLLPQYPHLLLLVHAAMPSPPNTANICTGTTGLYPL